MLKAVQNGVQYYNIPLAEALNMATAYPVKLIGRVNETGVIKEGVNANLDLEKVFFQGKEIKQN